MCIKKEAPAKTAVVKKDVPTNKAQKGHAKKGPAQKATPAKMDMSAKREELNQDTELDASIKKQRPARVEDSNEDDKFPKKAAPAKGVNKRRAPQKSQSEGGGEGGQGETRNGWRDGHGQ